VREAGRKLSSTPPRASKHTVIRPGSDMKEKSNRPRSETRLTGIEKISIAGTEARMAPLGLILYAQHYLKAAQSTEPHPNPNFSPVRTYLACHSLELALKAFLSLKKLSLQELSGGAYGHNLQSILHKAEEHGLADSVADISEYRENIQRASRYYAEKVFEYPAVGEALMAYPGNPNTDVLIEAAAVLVESLYDQCLHAE